MLVLQLCTDHHKHGSAPTVWSICGILQQGVRISAMFFPSKVLLPSDLSSAGLHEARSFE